MHRKQVVSSFITITIITINCVINAIQQLRKQAVMLYLIYSMIMMMFLLFPSSWIRFVFFFHASSHCFNHRRPVYTSSGFRNGCQTGFARVSSFISVLQKPHISRKSPLLWNGGETVLNAPLPDVSPVVPFCLLESRKHFLIFKCRFLRQNDSADRRSVTQTSSRR